MVDDFEYFAEFLEDPSVPDLNEFFRILRRWAKYIEAHKHEFNYLEDEEWREIRERVLEVLEIRIDEKVDLEEEWHEINEAIGKMSEEGNDQGLALYTRRLEFMKAYQNVFDIPDADIVEFEENVGKFAKLLQRARISEARLQFNRLAIAESIADIDEGLVEYYEKTGKIPSFPVYADKIKNYKGN